LWQAVKVGRAREREPDPKPTALTGIREVRESPPTDGPQWQHKWQHDGNALPERLPPAEGRGPTVGADIQRSPRPPCPADLVASGPRCRQ